jgi:hypothetical protein
MRELDLSACELGAAGDGVEQLCAFVGACSSLSSLQLSEMRALAAEAPPLLVEAALRNGALGALSLDLSSNQLEARAAARLARCFRAYAHQPTFDKLNLSGHRFGALATSQLLLALAGQPLVQLSVDGAMGGGGSSGAGGSNADGGVGGGDIVSVGSVVTLTAVVTVPEGVSPGSVLRLSHDGGDGVVLVWWWWCWCGRWGGVSSVGNISRRWVGRGVKVFAPVAIRTRIKWPFTHVSSGHSHMYQVAIRTRIKWCRDF